MKKVLLALCLLMSALSCDKTDDRPQAKPETTNYEQLNNQFNEKFSALFESPKTLNFISLVDKNKDRAIISIDLSKNSSDFKSKLIDNYFTNLKPVSDKIVDFRTGNQPLPYRTQSGDIGSYVNDIDRYSDTYKSLFTDFIKDIEGSDLYDINVVIAAFNEKVYNSTGLSEDEEIQLIAFSALTNSFFNFVKDGGLEQVHVSMLSEVGAQTSEGTSNGRVTGTPCKVNWRDVWRGGVEGFVVGAVRGAYVGATAGTVAVFGIGTVTGAVSGAVAMGAVGFAGGAGGTLVKQVIWNCVLSSSYEVSCKGYFEKFLNDEISLNSIPDACLRNIEIRGEFTPN
jgi:hypothetical protein